MPPGVFEVLARERVPMERAVCECAAGTGGAYCAQFFADETVCLKYAHENGCPWDESACAEAASWCQLECLKYLHENGCPWNEWTCEQAAQAGDVWCLEYAHENGCPWDERTCEEAAKAGDVECLQYAHESGCPIDVAKCITLSHGRDVRAYLESLSKCPYETAMAALDEVKDGMPDGNYKTIADALMHAHRAKRAHE